MFRSSAHLCKRRQTLGNILRWRVSTPTEQNDRLCCEPRKLWNVLGSSGSSFIKTEQDRMDKVGVSQPKWGRKMCKMAWLELAHTRSRDTTGPIGLPQYCAEHENPRQIVVFRYSALRFNRPHILFSCCRVWQLLSAGPPGI